jgi:hypothetical protein
MVVLLFGLMLKISIVVLSIFLPQIASAQDWLPLSRYYEFKSSPPETLLQSTYSTQAFELLSAREAMVDQLKTESEWLDRQRKVH